MFKYAKKMEEERQYYEDMLARSEQRQTANLLVGLAVGAVAGYCAKKYVLPKLAEVEYKERLSEETDFLKDRFNDLKHSFLSLKEKLPFGECCEDSCCCCDDEEECDDTCCCDDECCSDDECCCDDECCKDDQEEAQASETTEDVAEESTEDKEDETDKA